MSSGYFTRLQMGEKKNIKILSSCSLLRFLLGFKEDSISVMHIITSMVSIQRADRLIVYSYCTIFGSNSAIFYSCTETTGAKEDTRTLTQSLQHTILENLSRLSIHLTLYHFCACHNLPFYVCTEFYCLSKKPTKMFLPNSFSWTIHRAAET